ncbi:MAG: hypothetical protein QNJ16_08155 [Rhodobacter sp.]|nr:hypothetical protein [Rhodobacter sp.]
MRYLTKICMLSLAAFAPLALPALGQAKRELPPELQNVMTLDDYLAATAEIAPGFAGLYVDDGTLVIRIASKGQEPDTEQQRQVFAALDQAFGRSLDRFAEAPRRFEAAQTPIKPLLAARAALDAQAAKLGLTYSDVDERRGLIVMGLHREADDAPFWTAVEQTGLDRGFVELRRMGMPALRARVDDRVRPLVGGLKIRGKLRCTLGTVVEIVDTGEIGFLTASHCSNRLFEVDGRNFKQPGSGFGGTNDIGEELADPPADLSHPACTVDQCRYGDINLVQIGDNDTASVGRIARIGNWGGFTISSVDADYDLVGMVLFTLEGEVLTKVSAETGKTAAVARGTCSNLPHPGLRNSTGTFRLICQYSADASANVGGGVTPINLEGDSGSPVFTLNAGTAAHTSVLHGIMWGELEGPTGFEGDMYVYSPIFQNYADLYAEVGPLNFFNVSPN